MTAEDIENSSLSTEILRSAEANNHNNTSYLLYRGTGRCHLYDEQRTGRHVSRMLRICHVGGD